MIKRIKTTTRTAQNLDKIQNKLHLSSKAAILRICMSLSINDSTDLPDYAEGDYSNGFDISLSTLFGEYELLYKGLIRNHYNKEMSDDEYVKLIQAHIERGMIKLYGEFATSNSTEEMIRRLVGDRV